MEGLLANWLWQGCAVASAAAVLLRASRRMSATTRYRLWWVTLAVVLVLPAASLRLPASSSELPAPSFPQDAFVSVDSEQKALAGGSKPAAGGVVVLPPLPAWTGALLVFAWSVWAAISLSRTAAALVTLVRAKRSVRPFPEAREIRLRTWVLLRARGRRAHLTVSDHVRAAAVLGLTSPSIAVAPIVLDALTDAELDQIVVHEWAHVYRRDDVARLVQRVIVALAGLHPAVWWIDRQLHLERETACDDWAVNATGSARALAVSLTKLASLPGRGPDPLLLPAALSSSDLATRVVRLLDRRRNRSTARTLGAPILIAPLLGALALTVASVDLVVTAPAGPATSPDGAAMAAMAAMTEAAADASAVSPARPLVAPGAAGRSPQAVRAALRTPRPTRAAGGGASVDSSGALAESPGDVASTQTQHQDGRPPAFAAQVVDAREWGPDNLPGTRAGVTGDILPLHPAGLAAPAAPQPATGPTLWGAAADAGVIVGKGSQKAAVATAGFFTRLGKSVTHVF